MRPPGRSFTLTLTGGGRVAILLTGEPERRGFVVRKGGSGERFR